MVSIPTKNTYIDLEVQEYNTTGDGIEVYTQQRQEESQTDVEGIQVHREHRNKQKRKEVQGSMTEHEVYQQETIKNSGIDSMLPSPAPPYIDTVGVAEGGEDGCGQVDTSFYHDRNAKGKNKIVEQGSCSNVDKEPPDKIQLPNQQINFSYKNKNPSNTGKAPIDHQRDNFDEYREPDSKGEYHVDTHSLGDGIEPGEEITTSDQIQ